MVQYVRTCTHVRVRVRVCTHTYAFSAGVKVQRSDHGVNELQHKESSDHYVEAKIYTKEDQGKD